MPTYQYACTECEHQFDAVQSFTDETLTQCPECGGRLRKVFSAVGVVFKGSGFYRTDSRSSSTASEAGRPKDTKDSKDSPAADLTPKEPSRASKDSSGGGKDSAGGGKGSSGGAKESPAAAAPAPAAKSTAGSAA